MEQLAPPYRMAGLCAGVDPTALAQGHHCIIQLGYNAMQVWPLDVHWDMDMLA